MKSSTLLTTLLSATLCAATYELTDTHLLPSSTRPQKRQIVNPEDPQCVYLCDEVTPHEGMPLVSEVYALADDLASRGPDARCAISRAPGSTDASFTRIASSENVEVNLYFNDHWSTTGGYYVEYYCAEMADFVRAVVEICQPVTNVPDRVYGRTDIPNCRHVEGSLLWEGQAPGTYPGVKLEVGRYGAHEGM
ncbi:hypothetical protein EJ04DRAFT_581503 [Polyplosphaeria fusca]|uniref:Uncharacterized protein n=1 Tax=Polyplosphaeria fusca TaxID=682080 RepID=A0A9P4QNK1_9PLEO|nr:hypothetical protein EJ04DRAFT_581503 [Polyplosphaeria fusca]